MTVRVLLLAEFYHCANEAEAQARLDRFREKILPAHRYGICLSRATEEDFALFEELPLGQGGSSVLPALVD